jgi:hypothetical protein
MEISMIRKCLAIGIILLFVGVTIAPTINFQVVKASQNDDLVEVTTQACGIQGYGNTTVKLTRDQYQNLEEYLVGFRARLNQTTTREEAVPIFKDAVVELDKYGLLPRGLSVERAQKLVTKSYYQQLKVVDSEVDSDTNYFCLIAGVTSRTLFIGPILTAGFLLADFVYSKINRQLGQSILLSFLLVGLLSYFLPVKILSVIAIGLVLQNMANPEFYNEYPSHGWIFCIGLLGIRNWNGPFYGNLAWSNTYPVCVGAIGFTGIKIALLKECYFLGSALKTGISSDPPIIST